MGRYCNLPGAYHQEANKQKTLKFPQGRARRSLKVQTLRRGDEKSGRTGARIVYRMLTSVMDHKLNRQALEYASMAVAGAR